MVKLTLSYEKQNALTAAISQLDMYEVVGPDKTVRAPYKLGAERRTLVKNLRALQASIAVWQEITKEIFKENFPDVPDGVGVQRKDRPLEYDKYMAAISASAKEEDEVELIPFTEKVIYEDNEFPAAVCALLEEHGLVGGGAARPQLREVR